MSEQPADRPAGHPVEHPTGHSSGHPTEDDSPLEHWEGRYAGAEPIWSGRVNATLAEVAGRLPPGRSLDLGCGEGGDVLWLAEQGWHAQGIDLSPTAIARARAAARSRGFEGSAHFTARDLGGWDPAGRSYDLVTASFFHSHVTLDRTAILRRAAEALTVGGHLVVLSHAAPPPWAAAPHDGSAPPHEQLLTARQEAAELALPEHAFALVTAEELHREATGPAGEQGHLEDSLLVLRRLR